MAQIPETMTVLVEMEVTLQSRVAEAGTLRNLNSAILNLQISGVTINRVSLDKVSGLNRPVGIELGTDKELREEAEEAASEG